MESSNIENNMETKQIFESYDRRKHEVFDTWTYCPKCGARCRILPSGGCNRMTCPRCGFVLYRNPSPGVVALITSHDMILLGKRAQNVFEGGKWSLPGGFVEFEEDFISAAHREIREETGLSVKIVSILSVVSNFFSPELHTLVVVLLAEKHLGALQPGDDMVELAWFPLSGPFPPMAFDADEHIISRYHRTRLTGAPVDPQFASKQTVAQRGIHLSGH
jgi:8-oxo-dGTP diphosphatase